MADYHRSFEGLQEAIRGGETTAIRRIESLQEKLLIDCRRFADVRMKTGLSKKHRIGRIISQEEFDYFREEWISGKVHPGDPFKPAKLSRGWYRAESWPARWEMTDRAHILRVVDEIEDWTRHRLPRRDGWPYFAHPTTIPEDWNWVNCQSMMSERYIRMKTVCNRWFPTQDTIATLFLECIFQACVRNMRIGHDDPDLEVKTRLQNKYAEFLGLPLDVEFFNPLAFVIAHRHHGRQMRTGWPLNPTSFADRVDEHNNILIETRTSNYVKSDYDESYYPDIRTLFSEVQVPSNLANGDLVLPPFNPAFGQVPGNIVGIESDVSMKDDCFLEERLGLQTYNDDDEREILSSEHISFAT